MKKILITQRVDLFKNIGETRESIDIKFFDLFASLKMLPIQISSELINPDYKLYEFISNLSVDGIVLSGGNDIGSCKKRDELEKELLSYSKLKNIPIFGICRGLQMINNYQNGSLVKINGHCNNRHLVNWKGKSFSREVNSFHNFGITKNTLGNKLEPLAFAFDGTIEAIKHSDYPWLAIMWHPEREKVFQNFDLELISNHFNN